VCGSETLVLVSNEMKFTILAPSSGFEVISTTTSAGLFTLTKSIATSLCEIKSYGLYSDSAGTTALSYQAIAQDTSGSAVGNNYPIKINKSASFTRQDVYLKAETTGGKTAIKQLVIEVCGSETLALASSSTYKSALTPSAASLHTISSITTSAWQDLSKGSTSHCHIDDFSLYTD
jgi:hypothetical protein